MSEVNEISKIKTEKAALLKDVSESNSFIKWAEGKLNENPDMHPEIENILETAITTNKELKRAIADNATDVTGRN